MVGILACSTSVASIDTRKFTGKERDNESNLDMFGARYYGSSLGRFMTPDWATKPTAVPYAHYGNPQSLNLRGVEVTTGGKTSTGIYFDNPNSIQAENINGETTFVDHNPINLSGKAGSAVEGFSFFVNDNCGGTCLASGTFQYGLTADQTRTSLDLRGAFRSVVDRTIPGLGRSLDEMKFHWDTTQHRFGDGPSLHISVPRDPRATVPSSGPFHVDKDAPGLAHFGCAMAGIGCQ